MSGASTANSISLWMGNRSIKPGRRCATLAIVAHHAGGNQPSIAIRLYMMLRNAGDWLAKVRSARAHPPSAGEAPHSLGSRMTNRSPSRNSARTPSNICSAWSVAASSLSAAITIAGAISRRRADIRAWLVLNKKIVVSVCSQSSSIAAAYPGPINTTGQN